VLVAAWFLLKNTNIGKISQEYVQQQVQANDFARFADKYKTLDDVIEALQRSGLESSNLIIGIDYTASNEHQGRKTFGGKCLHRVAVDEWNPYQRVIKMIGQTLEKFDDDKFIPVFGFGDSLTRDTDVFPFIPDPNSPRYCQGFQEVLDVYNRITPGVTLSGPTNFAPLIYKAIETVFGSDNRASYHILVIIADGQVVNEKDTQDAIVEASKYPLSIIMVGVGDGPCLFKFM
jgi:E3 ubiquitin-protein ligase RGLG